ncbi:Hypothetical predicted protein [Olea europaea subsp. europaea]|uniref:Uncharacterized protein n=1 Tax=Olea europaea subsp. europaea TaxID=158383 RepID=A0A8S0VEY2_OLEEU|nr:Hypothetical predicted protein [Olea europaea subsp. europaea]
MKLKCTGGNVQQLHNLDEIEKIGQDKRPEIEKKGQNAPESCLNRASENICLVKGRPISLEEKRYLREELVKLSSFSSERLSDCDHPVDSKPACGLKYPLTSRTRGLKLESDGHERVSNEDSYQQSVSSLPTTAVVDKGTTVTGNTSPNKDEKINPVNRQRERERLERQRLAEKTRSAAGFRAVEATLRMKAEAESKMQREREREAARIAVEKMTKTVDIDENREIMEELEAIMGAISSGNLRNPLEQLGLHIKDDYMEDDEEAVLQGEEEEILS